MAQYTLAQVLQDVGASVSQDITAPEGTSEAVQINFADRSQRDWADYYNWKTLRSSFAPTVLASMTSIGLPQRFDRLSSPVYDMSLTANNKYLEIKPDERYQKLSTERYCYVLGDDSSGKYLIINPALPSGASIVFDFQSAPSSLVSVNDTVTCNSREFMAKRIEYYIFKARSDARFPSVKEESEEELSKMVEKENTPTGGENNRTPDWATKSNFRIGND